MIAEKRRREDGEELPVPDGPGMAGPRGGSKVGSAPSFGNTSEYSRAKSRKMYRNKIKKNNRTGTTMRVNNYQRNVSNNNKTINSYRTQSANTNINRHNNSNTTRVNQRLYQRRK